MDLDGGGNKRIFNRLGAQPDPTHKTQKVCFHWRAGKCNRHPCPFLHRELGAPPPQLNGTKRFAATSDGPSGPRGRGPNTFNNGGGGGSNTWGRSGGSGGARVFVRKMDKVCNYWMQDKCGYGDRCKFLHSWSTGDCVSLLTTLDGHSDVVTGITLPLGSDKLYTGSKDETVRVWDCQSGQCTGEIKLGGEVGCMISEGPWIFVGIPNIVKAWNTQANTELSLSGPVGQVYAMVVGNELLFAGTQDGPILAWKFNTVTNCFEPTASLIGHTLGVVSLVVGANRLYSGSVDQSIRVWNLENLQCIQTLIEHTAVVMSVLCWDQFLLSSSLDQKLKIWAATQSGNLEVTYTHDEDHPLLTLCGMHDSEAKPVLLCACNDNTVRLYDLPSFSERGKIFSKQEIRAIQVGPGCLFFTGDGTGQVRVWKWLAEPVATT